ncbi:MAG: UDP-N-acetylglucosamine diphosphorylase [Candidatus Nitronauta litoralis]|uniref:UDP-N-acetylglucosamine diphosphorylase n=1 Tax=Candidatus Nitronauta litoralis TaxID=2705533 RepID=A0A7T0BUZ4_9BACT|nr:MAG: UDP-N-acetylglucosamine diphosphorylase [Candidatus Nitronauta litoralis]
MIDISELFPHLKDFRHQSIFEGVSAPWDVLKKLAPYLKEQLHQIGNGADQLESHDGLTITDGTQGSDPGFIVKEWISLDSPTFFPKLGIYLGAGTKLEPSAIVKGPCIIGDRCDVRQGAYLRGSVIAGDRCTLGHATEIKNSILMNHTEVGHFNYIGDSVLGSFVNLGAGTKLANLQFRTDEEKLKEIFPPIHMPADKGEIETGLNKLGSIIGDHSELGCNAVLSPGVVLGAHNWVYPNFTLPKGIYPPRQIFLPRDIKPRNKNR